MLNLSNMMLEFSDNMENVNEMLGTSFEYSGAGSNFSNPELSTWYKQMFSSTVPIFPTSSNVAPTQPQTQNRTHTVVNGDTLWDLAKKYYGDVNKWGTILSANGGIDPRKLKIGSRLIIPFKTGGFTGDWFGEDGKIAMLHKKELVLNEQQTQDILNTAKLIDGLKAMIPKTFANGFQQTIASNGTNGITIEEMNFTFPDFKGTKENAKTMFDVFVTELKKR